MYWNHRVIEKEYNEIGTDEWVKYYEVHEVHYEDNGKVMGWTAEPVAPYGESVEELKSVLMRMIVAAERPILKIVNEKLAEVK